MNQASYWQAQEDRWHQMYIEAEKTIGKQEVIIEELRSALRNIMPYASTGASVHDVHITEQPEFVAVKKVLNNV